MGEVSGVFDASEAVAGKFSGLLGTLDGHKR